VNVRSSSPPENGHTGNDAAALARREIVFWPAMQLGPDLMDETNIVLGARVKLTKENHHLDRDIRRRIKHSKKSNALGEVVGFVDAAGNSRGIVFPNVPPGHAVLKFQGSFVVVLKFHHLTIHFLSFSRWAGHQLGEAFGCHWHFSSHTYYSVECDPSGQG
jgi:hypothetical protein